MKWLLDADVLSQPAKRAGDARVIAWLEAQEPHCYTSTVVIGQLGALGSDEKGRAARSFASVAASAGECV